MHCSIAGHLNNDETSELIAKTRQEISIHTPERLDKIDELYNLNRNDNVLNGI